MISRSMDKQGFSVIECLGERSPREAARDGRSPEGVSCRGAANQCVEFFPGAFDPANPRKRGALEVIQEKKWDNTPEDNGAPWARVRHGRSPKGELRAQRINLRHDVTDELAAYKLAQLPFPGVFGVFYQSDRPTKNALEKKWIDSTREKLGHPSALALLQKTFDRMK